MPPTDHLIEAAFGAAALVATLRKLTPARANVAAPAPSRIDGHWTVAMAALLASLVAVWAFVGVDLTTSALEGARILVQNVVIVFCWAFGGVSLVDRVSDRFADRLRVGAADGDLLAPPATVVPISNIRPSRPATGTEDS